MNAFIHTRGTSVAALVAACALGTLPAVTFGRAVDDDVRSVTVHFADLDLGSPSGGERLYRRLSIAARDVCSDEAEIIDLRELADIRACRSEALEDAVARAERPMLTAAYENHHPGTVLVSATVDVGAAYR